MKLEDIEALVARELTDVSIWKGDKLVRVRLEYSVRSRGETERRQLTRKQALQILEGDN